MMGQGMTLPTQQVLDRDTAFRGLRWWSEASEASEATLTRREIAVRWEETWFEVRVMTETEINDEALLARVAGGDVEAFAAFYDRHEAVLFGVAWRILRDDREAEDVLQDAAVLIWERVADYRADLGRPMSWAVTMVRNKAIDRLRASRRRGELMERITVEVDVAEELATRRGEWGGEDRTLAVRRALAGLPVEQRRAIELAFFGGLSQTEIAEQEVTPLGTVKARIRRGMMAMRDALEGNL